MVAGWSLWVWIFAALICAFAMTWWILTKEPNPAAVMLVAISFGLFVIPALVAMQNQIQCRPGPALLLPIERKTYIRQLGMAVALSQFQLWAGLSVVPLLWGLATAPLLPQLAMLIGVLAFSAAFQVLVFGALTWTARYRSKALVYYVAIAGLLPTLFVVQLRLMLFPGPLPHDLMWIAGITAVVGLLITLDAYRRWLVTDFD